MIGQACQLLGVSEDIALVAEVASGIGGLLTLYGGVRVALVWRANRKAAVRDITGASTDPTFYREIRAIKSARVTKMNMTRTDMGTLLVGAVLVATSFVISAACVWL